MAEITRADLEAFSNDLKEHVDTQTKHVREVLGLQIGGTNERLDRVGAHLDKLNSKTDKNITDIAALQRDVHNLGKEVFRRRDDRPRAPTGPARDGAPSDDLTRGPSWRMVGMGLGAIAAVGTGVWEGLKAAKWVLGLMSRTP